MQIRQRRKSLFFSFPAYYVQYSVFLPMINKGSPPTKECCEEEEEEEEAANEPVSVTDGNATDITTTRQIR